MIYKITVVGVIVSAISIVLKKYSKEMIIPMELVYLSAVVILLVSVSSEIFEVLSGYFEKADSGEKMFRDIIKASGICFLSKFSSDICRENSGLMIADIIDLSGRVMLAVIALPYLESIIGIATAFAK